MLKLMLEMDWMSDVRFLKKAILLDNPFMQHQNTNLTIHLFCYFCHLCKPS